MHSLRNIAATLDGQIAGRDSVLVPGPGRSRRDRSLKVRFKSDGTLHRSNDWRREPANDDTPVIGLHDRGDDEPARIRSAMKYLARGVHCRHCRAPG